VRPTHLLFDFFGTLVEYDVGHPPRPDGTLAALAARGHPLTLDEFLAAWDATWSAWEQACAPRHREFSMVEVATSFLGSLEGASPRPSDVDEFVAVFIADWNAGVRYPPGVPELLTDLAARYRLAVVSNTHEPDLVPGHLAGMGVADLFDAVVTSVEVGRRKPHPAVYATALDRLGVTAAEAVFVGDSVGPDYAGPTAAGMRAYLIDPVGVAPVPDDRRLGSVLDLASVLSTAHSWASPSCNPA
jgi:putative hydrolase of the HAD superfamily